MSQWNVTVNRVQTIRFTVEADTEHGAWIDAVDYDRYHEYDYIDHSRTDETTIGGSKQ